jgi:3-hydroxyacyl-CoA dehydrogenase
MRTVRRVAVLGAGTMGSRIAAHFANAGVPSLLLDVVLPNQPDRNAAARKGIENASKAFFTDYTSVLVKPGNYEDDLAEIQRCDWILEAVTEDLAIKRAVLERVAPWRRPGAIVSTNTSGIPLARIAEGFPAEFRGNFLGTHFFNPPRYLHLVEVIPCADTHPEVLGFVSDFCDRHLGKGVVPAKDTPNFVANRIGSFFGATAQKIMLEDDYTLEEVEALTGPLIGLPRSASFRLLDIIGLDVWAAMGRNLYALAPHDLWRDRFLPTPLVEEMIRRGWLGEKTGQGFYRRVGAAKEIQMLDRKTLEYRPVRKVVFPSAQEAQSIEDLPQRLRILVRSADRAGSFLWKLFSELFRYSAERVPEISDRIVEIDRAMRWGYAHSLGPFELWDALGVEETAQRLDSIPPAVQAMLASGAKSFYRPADAEGQPHTEYFDLRTTRYLPREERPGVLALAEIKRARGVVKETPGGALIDLGDGVLCLEFRGGLKASDEGQAELMQAAIQETTSNYAALVITAQGDHFSPSRDVAPGFLSGFPPPKPVVVAPFGNTLGVGSELVQRATCVQAAAELYLEGSSSAEDARRRGLLRPTDFVSMNPERLLADAKALALSLVGDSSQQSGGEKQTKRQKAKVKRQK